MSDRGLYNDKMAFKMLVYNYWNSKVCDTQDDRGFTKLKDLPKYSRAYFEEIENKRVASRQFMDATRYTDKRVLEVGVGSGVDFVQWCRAGCDAYGVDLTEAATDHCRKWLSCYGLKGNVRIGDATRLDFLDNSFDLVYSWGVLHHTDTKKAIQECIRVCKPRGEIKLMLYNRRSLIAFGLWLRGIYHGHLSMRSSISHGIESLGTQAFTITEIQQMCTGVKTCRTKSLTCRYDKLERLNMPIRVIARLFNYITNERAGWFTTVEMIK